MISGQLTYAEISMWEYCLWFSYNNGICSWNIHAVQWDEHGNIFGLIKHGCELPECLRCRCSDAPKSATLSRLLPVLHLRFFWVNAEYGLNKKGPRQHPWCDTGVVPWNAALPSNTLNQSETSLRSTWPPHGHAANQLERVCKSPKPAFINMNSYGFCVCVCVLTTCLLTPRENKKNVAFTFYDFYDLRSPTSISEGIETCQEALDPCESQWDPMQLGAFVTQTQNLIECDRLLQGGCQQVANKVTRICSLAWSKKTCLNLMKSDCVFAEFCNVFPVWVLLYILYILGLSFLNLALYVPFSCCRPRNVTVPICTYAKVGVVVAAKPFVETFHLLWVVRSYPVIR